MCPVVIVSQEVSQESVPLPLPGPMCPRSEMSQVWCVPWSLYGYTAMCPRVIVSLDRSVPPRTDWSDFYLSHYIVTMSLSPSPGLQCTSFNLIDWRHYGCDGDVTAVVISRFSRLGSSVPLVKHTAHIHVHAHACTHTHTHTCVYIYPSIPLCRLCHLVPTFLSTCAWNGTHWSWDTGPGTLWSWDTLVGDTSVRGHIETGTLWSWALILGHICMTPCIVLT